jgi:hypothetical protein
MSTWTATAVQTLERYLQHNRLRVAASGADPDEVTADLRRHVEEEVAALQLPVVTEKDVRLIVNQIGSVPEEEVSLPAEPPPARRPNPGLIGGLTSMVLILFGVVLPSITIGFELFTRLCSGMLFDPIPTGLHLALAVCVPVANLLAWKAARDPGTAVPRWVWLANGAVCGISLFFTLIFLPVAFLAVLAIVYYGLGFLPLCPLLSFSCAMHLRTLLKRRQLVREESVRRGWGWALTASFALLLVLELPVPLTRHWVIQTESDSPEVSRRAIERLRIWGHEGILLRECYGRSSRHWTELFTGRKSGPNPDFAKAYFRVTGKPFNSKPPPFTKYQAVGRAILDEFEWDTALGGTSVAGQVRGLSLAQSRFDGVCRADEGWAYVEWILEFRNDHERNQREARAQVALPPGAVVSRLTLWVNGEEREAAFAGRSQVREAYQKVAVVQRRDPVLVTASGPDRVLVQCFPIAPGGGTMKVRLGVTAPLVMENANQTALRLPSFVERNFAVPPDLEHSLWLETPDHPATRLSRLTLDSSKPDRVAVRGQFTDAELASPESTLRFTTSSKLQSVRAKDKTDELHIITQTLETTLAKIPGRLAIVLDGSDEMSAFFPEIAHSLERLPTPLELAIFLAQDGVKQIYRSHGTNREPVSAIVGRLRGVGGQDDLPALLEAWDWAAAKPASMLLWIHGTQPVLLGKVELLKQRLEWRAGQGPAILDVATWPGPNRIAEQLSHLDACAALPRLGELRDDLERLFETWSGQRSEFRFVRTDEKETGSAGNGEELPATASSHVVRLWANDQVQWLIGLRKNTTAIELAAHYQIVTPVSGAVVLETKKQLADAGLTPADPMTVPSVPEPSTWTLLLAGLAGLFLWRKRKAITFS